MLDRETRVHARFTYELLSLPFSLHRALSRFIRSILAHTIVQFTRLLRRKYVVIGVARQKLFSGYTIDHFLFSEARENESESKSTTVMRSHDFESKARTMELPFSFVLIFHHS